MTEYYKDHARNNFVVKNEDEEILHISESLRITREDDIDLESHWWRKSSAERFKSWIGDYKILFIKVFKDD